MALFWIFLALCAGFVFYGLAVPSDYVRRFASSTSGPQVLDGYLIPEEVVDPDEDGITERVSHAVANDTLRRPRLAGADDPLFHEPHWGHTGALLRGTLEIDGIDALPPLFRVGLFEATGRYPLVARTGIAKDSKLGFAIHRLALKLEMPEAVPNVYDPSGTARELDLLFASGESRTNGEGHTFFARDAKQLDLAAKLDPPSMATLKALANWRNIAVLLGVKNEVKRAMGPARQAPFSRQGWAGRSYFALGPFALGQGAMKISLTPLQSHDVDHADPLKGDIAARNLAETEAWLAAGEAARFSIAVQLATPDCLPEPGPGDPPKSVMAAEYCDLRWDEATSPFIPVGTLTLEADPAINTPEHWAGLQFNAWNTVDAMRPLGQLFRARKHVHAAHSKARVSHLYGRDPGAMTGKCPFH